MPFIKSHSNYVLKSKHQDINDGTIFERDITTIGAVDQFSPRQTPIYRSNNFIVTVRNDGRPANQYNTSKWKENVSGETWTLQTINSMVSDFEEEDDTKIVLKQDYYDFRDFAYYGSLTELFRASVTDIVARFPGELYVTNDHAYYNTTTMEDFDRIESSVMLGGEEYYFVSNPFNIDLHTKVKPTDADSLKYFADDGYLNYQIGIDMNPINPDCPDEHIEKLVWDDIIEWDVEYFDPCDITCMCNKLKVQPQTSNISASGGKGVVIATYNISTCVKNINAVSSDGWINNISVSNGSIIADVDKYTDKTKPRTATITVTGDAEDEGQCSKEFTFIQNRDKCTCESFSAKEGDIIDATGGTVTVGTFTAGGCIDSFNATVEKSATDWVSGVHIEGNAVIATVKEYRGRVNDRKALITVTANAKDEGKCTASFEFTQSRRLTACTCDNFTSTAAEPILPAGGTVTVGTFTYEPCMKNMNATVAASASGWVHDVAIVGNSITARVDSYDSKLQPRKALITVTADAEDAPEGKCTTSFEFTQEKLPCTCAGFNATGIETEVPAIGGTMIVGTFTADDCVNSITATVATSAEGWVHEVVIEGHNIKARIDENTDITNPRTAKITVTGNALDAQNPCSASFEFTQVKKYVPPCNCEDLNISKVTTQLTTFETNTYNGGNGRALRSLTKGTSSTIVQEPSKTLATIGTEQTRSSSRQELYRRVAAIIIYTNNSSEPYTFYAYLDNDDNVIYLSKEENIGIHIRPKDTFLDTFYNECDNFQRLLVNKDTGYKATFSVIRENEFGYYREFVPFQFPTSYGNYNLDATDYGFNAYTTQMVQIGEYYDENFTDNLWRSMTHEAIKNFDWTYTREYVEGDEEEYVFGGQRIQKALRIFAREFDEIISYINNIKNLNRVTYDERSNIPDYFLTDVVENEGWNVKLVYPYELNEYYVGTRIKVDDELYLEGGNCDGQLDNVAPPSSALSATNESMESGTTKIKREFSQVSKKKVKPYSHWMIADGSEEGYFIACNDTACTPTEGDVTVKVTPSIIDPCGGSVNITWTKTFDEGSYRPINPIPCEYADTDYVLIKADGDTTYLDKCALGGKGALKNRIKSYTDEAEWSYQDANNEFLRRLKINSRNIWRHKGTVEGLEMILGMFGMKSKRWVEAQPDWIRNCKYSDDEGNMMWDFDVQEYTSFTNRIEETWDVVHQDYRINWINSTKAITYDNRFISNYNKYGANENALPYQGIPVSYRYAYMSPNNEGDTATTYDPYLTYGEGDDKHYYLDEFNNKILKRYLYPNFNKEEQLDGNPYFQMRGGWLAKSIVSDTTGETNTWNFQFDVDDNIVYSRYLEKGSVDEEGFINDNKPLFKETVRNIRRVDGIGNLLTIPTIELYNGIICNVTRIEKDAAVIDNVIYPINKVWHFDDYTAGGTDSTSGSVKQYISLVKTNGFIKVGNNKFFDTNIIVYDIEGSAHTYDIESKADGYELKAYIIDDYDESSSAHSYSFLCQEDYEGNYSISNFQVLDELPSKGYSNYFILDDINYADNLAKYIGSGDTAATSATSDDWTSGWRRLAETDKEYLKINTIINDYEGNNPHNGNMIYDNGHEYFTYFKRLFKYSADNELFDERCYEDFYATLDDEIVDYGFKNLIEENEDILQYDTFLVPDSKIHYFGNYKTKSGEGKSDGSINIDKVWIYGDDTYRLSGITNSSGATGGYDRIYSADTTDISMYNLSADSISNTASTDIGWVESFNPYNAMTANTSDTADTTVIDEVTNQIVNNKIFDITFRLHNVWYTKEGQEELKYIDDVVMNYLTQMIPSTTILRVKYDLSDVIPTVVVIDDEDEPIDTGCSTSRTEIVQVIATIGKNCTKSSVNVTTDSEGKEIPLTQFGVQANVMQSAGPCCKGDNKCLDCEEPKPKCACKDLIFTKQ